MKESIDIHVLIIRLLSGEADQSESEQVNAWLQQSEENKKLFSEMRDIWLGSSVSANADRYDLETAIRNFRVKTGIKKAADKKFQLFAPIFKYAAIFILAFLIGGASFYFYYGQLEPELVYNEIQVPNGEKSMISLYDGTKVWLNSGSVLRYPATFSKNERKVYLDGEGFFDVAEDKTCPFIVNAHELDVKVLGTRFNVEAYDDQQNVQVTLERGAVYAQEHNGEGGVVLAPGEQAIYNRSTKKLSQIEVDPLIYSSWKENLLRFEDTPLIEVVRKMEHWYGVKITLDESVDPQDKFTMSIKTESLREMLNLIAKTIPVKYEIDGDNVFIARL